MENKPINKSKIRIYEDQTQIGQFIKVRPVVAIKPMKPRCPIALVTFPRASIFESLSVSAKNANARH